MRGGLGRPVPLSVATVDHLLYAPLGPFVWTPDNPKYLALLRVGTHFSSKPGRDADPRAGAEGAANPVGGDAHYWSGGSFRVEDLDGSGGGLYSPVDPIIRALGDISIETYEGSLLHVLAGGSVTIDTAKITTSEPGSIGVDFLQETLTLSDGTVVAIDGGAQPTLDIRAGVVPEAIGIVPPGNISGLNGTSDILVGFTPTDTPSRADITVGDVWINAPNGLVLLTNQYQPNANLAGGSILVTGEGSRILVPGDERGINARGQGGQGGAVYLDARNDVSIDNSLIATSGAGTVGDIVINAGDTVRFEGPDRRTVAVSGLGAGVTGTAGDIRMRATNVELINGAQLGASTFGNGDAGNVVIEARDRVNLQGFDVLRDVPLNKVPDVLIAVGCICAAMHHWEGRRLVPYFLACP